MNELEQKVNALISLCTARDAAAERSARQVLEALQKKGRRAEKNGSVQAQVRRVLRELGVPEHLTGHAYLLEAVTLVLQEPAYLRRVTAGLYPAVAKRFASTPARVERSMRHAIETAWSRCALDTLDRYFGNTVSPTRGKPVNSEFIARVSSAVRLGE